MKRFLTIFPKAENVHLIKDVGMIPFTLQQELNYDCTLACYKNGDYPYLQTEVRGLKVKFIRRWFNIMFLDVLIFVISNRKQYEILHLFHLDKYSLLTAWFFKIIHFGKVQVYLKMDCNDLIRNKKESSFKKSVFRMLLSKIDLISVETVKLQQFLSAKWQLDIKYVPNGFADEGKRSIIPFAEKENIILTVGRIGTYVKATEILCEGFEKFAQEDNSWKLHVVGPVEPTFEEYIRLYFERNPLLKARVKFFGPVADRESLSGCYEKAKIFVLPSKWEGFPLVFLEAARAGCYIVSTQISATYDITDNERLGSAFPIDDAAALGNTLKAVTADTARLSLVCDEIQQYVYDRFYWPEICRRIDSYLNKQQR